MANNNHPQVREARGNVSPPSLVRQLAGSYDAAAPRNPPPKRHWPRWLLLSLTAIALLVLGWIYGRPWLVRALTTVSTDDAFVNSHVSSISARVTGYVAAIYVDDNDRVKKGDLLLELDHEPYQVTLAQRRAALEVADSNLTAAMAQARAEEAKARASWYSLVNAQEQVHFQIATIRANVAALRLQEANQKLAQQEIERVRRLVRKEAASIEELDQRIANLEVARQRVADARETIRRTRAGLGLPPNDANPTDVPKDLEQEFSAVQTALSNTAQALAVIGVPLKLYHLTPDQLYKQLIDMDPSGDLNRTLDRFVDKAPAVVQARAARDQAREDLKYAKLNLSYTYVYAPLDGQINRRSVNAGDNVAVNQGLMSMRSLSDIWIDANFKETQLDNIRVGHPVDVFVDAYPHKIFHGRVQGFSAGTGSSTALLPPENATGNFVKIVQRLPVRITINPEDMTEDTPLFVGLSVEPHVRYKEQPTGPDAGKRLLEPTRPPER